MFELSKNALLISKNKLQQSIDGNYRQTFVYLFPNLDGLGSVCHQK